MTRVQPYESVYTVINQDVNNRMEWVPFSNAQKPLASTSSPDMTHTSKDVKTIPKKGRTSISWQELFD